MYRDLRTPKLKVIGENISEKLAVRSTFNEMKMPLLNKRHFPDQRGAENCFVFSIPY